MRTLSLLIVPLLLAAPSWAQTETLKGRVLDSTGAFIIDASVTGYRGDEVVAETRTDDGGEFELLLPPGEYRLEVSAADFASYIQLIQVQSDMDPLAITLLVAPFLQALDVEEAPYIISLEPDQNLTAIVLDEEDLRDLPDDEEELAELLREMAGPGADATGGTDFIVDGFSGGQLPPKDQIREIRINRNPFSAEYSRPGHGRIEVFTRAGTDQFRGNLSFNFRDESLNARNAFADTKPPYQQRSLRVNLSGPILRERMSFSLSARRSTAEDSDTVQAITADGPFSTAIVRPNRRNEWMGRSKYDLSRNHSLGLMARYSTRDRENQGVGGFTLPERASESESNNFTFQVSETSILSNAMVHETRFRFRRNRSRTEPLGEGVAINVLDSFRSGGATNRSRQTDRNYQFGNALMATFGNLSLKTGLQADYQQYHSLSENNFLGTFVFSSLEAFQENRPTTFTINSGDPRLDTNQFELSAFLQSDLRLKPNLTLSFGLRYEAQTNIGDKNNFDPRLGVAYALGRTTVLRGGVGLFHQRLGTGTVASLLRLDGSRQLQTVIRNPSYPDPFVIGDGMEAIPPTSLRERAGDLALPYTMNSSVSFEKRLPKGLFVAVSYNFVRGIHLYRSRNLNAPLPGETEAPDPTRGNINLLESTAASSYHSLGLRVNGRIGRTSIFVRYTYSRNYSDTDGAFSLPANNHDLRADWGRSSQDRRHSVFTGFTLQLPWNLSANTRLRANSGRPFNITTGFDDNNDTVTNDRPAGVKRNSGEGPGLFNIDLTLSKTISLKSNGNGQQGRNFPGGSPPPGRIGGPGRGGGGGGGGFGGRGGRGRGGGPEMRIFANLRNVLNHTNFTRFSGVLTSPFFGQPNSARSPREVEMGVRFSF
ncbi:MAG: carboxypeptidase regulatory-like domain-containing protein [Acidobacteria bacterium]|nr:carboxypeptidase regulatory-like domain-containing protein [Acidobacteriota bacterium]